MKKILIIFFSILFMIFSFSSYSFAKNFYPATAINGGGTGALDKIDGSGLSNGDVAFVVLENDGTYGNALLIYVLDDDSAAAESSPTVISPDTNAGTKRWELTNIVSSSFTTPKVSGVAGLSYVYEADTTSTLYRGVMGPVDVAASWSMQWSSSDPANSFMLFAAPTGTGDPNGNAISAMSWVTPAANFTTFMAIPSVANFVAALSDEGAFAATLLGYADAATLYSGVKQSATSSATGAVELAITSEVNTGTDDTRAVTPDALAGSTYGTVFILLRAHEYATALTVADGKDYFVVPPELNGWNLVSVFGSVGTASSSGTPTFNVYNVTDSQDMLSTALTIDANEKNSSTAATPAVINGTYDDVATGDEIRLDCDVAGTSTTGGDVLLGFRLP